MRRVQTRIALALAALAAALLLAACGSSDDGDGATTAGSGSGGGTFKVGYLGPIAGPLAYLTEGDLAGLRTYLDGVNADGGANGRKIELVVLDDQAKPDTAATQYRQLVRDGVGVVAGMPISTTGEALVRDTDRNEVALLGYGLVTETLMASPYSFTTGWTPEQYVQAVAEFVESRELGDGAKLAFVGSETPASREAARLIAEHGKESGAWSVVGEAFLPATLTDVNPSLAPIARQRPDAIVQWTPSLPIIAAAYRAQGMTDVPILAPYYTDEVQGAALRLPNYYYPQLFVSPASNDPGVRSIALAAARAGAGGAQDKPYFGFGYAAGALIAAALERCEGDCDGAAFAAALRETDTEVRGFSHGQFGFAGGSRVAFTSARWMHFDPRGGYATRPVTDWFDVD
ncbi:ABC transporter substrate-binding protein [Conexibacter arvalis]|uniref:Branched-chain amino acid transport system substrate-binding protein n=1 Tax=Conexibacter arvalis TaxID=912552 RepID=A0A840I7Z8_9ACTN|nr:ABC transporter substrate-binding protein [Conexibacter arvalis]MBB4660642.1 branched-chain amino acid transport system substrate-binding protein [Conexibacter arvalis]